MWRVGSGGVSVKKSKFLRILELLEFPRKIGQTAGSAGLAGHSIGCSIKFETSFIIIWFFEKVSKANLPRTFMDHGLENFFWTQNRSKAKPKHKKQKVRVVENWQANICYFLVFWSELPSSLKKLFFLKKNFSADFFWKPFSFSKK